MIFKKVNGQIFDVELSKKEQKAVDIEINRQILERNRQFVDDFDYMVMKLLHDHFVFFAESVVSTTLSAKNTMLWKSTTKWLMPACTLPARK